jgi:hypothetical protein
MFEARVVRLRHEPQPLVDEAALRRRVQRQRPRAGRGEPLGHGDRQATGDARAAGVRQHADTADPATRVEAHAEGGADDVRAALGDEDEPPGVRCAMAIVSRRNAPL